MTWQSTPAHSSWSRPPRRCTCARCDVLRGRGVRVPRFQIALWHAGIALWVIGFFSPIHTLGDDLLSAHMAQHLLIADLAAPLLLVGARNPVLALPAAAAGARDARPVGSAAGRVPVAAAAAGGGPRLRARPVRLALRDPLRGRRAVPVRARPPAHELRGDRRARVVVGAGAEAAAAARRAVEGAVPDRRADGRDAARDELRAHPRAGLHGRLRRRGPRARADRARPTSSSRAA